LNRLAVFLDVIAAPVAQTPERRRRQLLYLAAGAKEVWICDQAGQLHFFDGTGERVESALFAAMPKSAD
jgi:hypothetical protein